jgi:hypothetical protein
METIAVTIRCNIQNRGVEDFSLIPIKGIVDWRGEKIAGTYKKKKGIKNFLVVVKSSGEELTNDSITEFIKNRIGYYNFSCRISLRCLEVSSDRAAEHLYKILPELEEFIK